MRSGLFALRTARTIVGSSEALRSRARDLDDEVAFAASSEDFP